MEIEIIMLCGSKCNKPKVTFTNFMKPVSRSRVWNCLETVKNDPKSTLFKPKNQRKDMKTDWRANMVIFKDLIYKNRYGIKKTITSRPVGGRIITEVPYKKIARNKDLRERLFKNLM